MNSEQTGWNIRGQLDRRNLGWQLDRGDGGGELHARYRRRQLYSGNVVRQFDGRDVGGERERWEADGHRQDGQGQGVDIRRYRNRGRGRLGRRRSCLPGVFRPAWPAPRMHRPSCTAVAHSVGSSCLLAGSRYGSRLLAGRHRGERPPGWRYRHYDEICDLRLSPGSRAGAETRLHFPWAARVIPAPDVGKTVVAVKVTHPAESSPFRHCDVINPFGQCGRSGVMPGASTGFAFLVQNANRPEADTRATPAVSWGPQRSIARGRVAHRHGRRCGACVRMRDRVVDYSLMSFASVVLFLSVATQAGETCPSHQVRHAIIDHHGGFS